jgi:exodeoxyribonuclease VII large subunit
LSYHSVLARGFALVRDEHGHMVRSAAAIAPGAIIGVEFADGAIAAKAEGSSSPPPNPSGEKPKPDPRAAKTTRTRTGKTGGQGSLF